MRGGEGKYRNKGKKRGIHKVKMGGNGRWRGRWRRRWEGREKKREEEKTEE